MAEPRFPRFAALRRRRGLDDGGGGHCSAAVLRTTPHPFPAHPPWHPPSHPSSLFPYSPLLPSAPNATAAGAAAASQPGLDGPVRAGPGRAGPGWIFCTNCNVVARAAALPGGVAACAAGRRASTAALACAVPRARRSRTRAAGGARGGRSAKLIKVYTWFTHWCAGAKKGFLTVYLQFTNNGERFAL